MALQVEVEFGRVNYVTVHDRASRAIPTFISPICRGEETNVMSFPNDNNGDVGGYSEFLACL